MHVLLLVFRLRQRNQLPEVNRRNYVDIDNQPQVNVELNNPDEVQPLLVNGPLVVNAPAEEGQQQAEEEQQPAEGGQQPAEGGQQPAEGGQQPAEGGQQPAEGGQQRAEGGQQPRCPIQ